MPGREVVWGDIYMEWTGRWVIVGCSLWVGGIDSPDGRLHSVGKGKGAVEGEGKDEDAGDVECVST